MSFKPPSLINLCIKAITDAILDEDGNISYVYALPSELFDQIVSNLPPLALQNLQDAMPSGNSSDSSFFDDSSSPSKKRKRFHNFDMAWKELYQSRWPDDQNTPVTSNWQYMYWEKHLQNCIDETVETISSTSFDGHLGDVVLSDSFLTYISTKGHVQKSRSYSKFSYHCERFGEYARCLRLQSVHFVSDIAYLLKESRLESLEISWIKSKEQVDGLCKLLAQNKKTLASLDFIHCKLVAKFVTAICESLHVKGGFETNKIENFSIKTSSFLDSLHFPLPLGLELLISDARGLTSLVLSDNRLPSKTAKFVFDILFEAESGIRVLDLSDNNIAGWLSHFSMKPNPQINKSLKFLRVLNLRGNNLQEDDASCLINAMVYMPNVEVLNLSDNCLQYVGIMELVQYLIKKSKCVTPLAELYLENCGLNYTEARMLIKGLVRFKVPLKSLSIEDNKIHRKFGKTLGRFLSSGIQCLNVKGIGLGSLGFAAAQKEIENELSVVNLNISDNAGSDQTASFMLTVISNAPNLVSIDASINRISVESVPTICSILEVANGQLEHLDLSCNPLCEYPNIVSHLAEYQINGKPNILLSKPVTIRYDQDP